MSIKVHELEALLGLLGVAGPVRGMAGSPGSRRPGMTGAGMEDLLKDILSDEDYMSEFRSRKSPAEVARLEELARKEGSRMGRKRALEKTKAKKPLLGAGGKIAGRLGSKLLVGGGLLGTGLMALDVLSMLKEGAQDDTYKQLRSGSGGELQSSLAAMTGPREMDRLRASQGFRRRAEMNRTVNPRVSSDLRALLEDRQIRELAGAGQSIKPSIREAYARMGLFA